MKLTLNGNCKGIAAALRADGHDVELAVETPGGDVEIQRKAQEAGRIVITADGASWEQPTIHAMRTGGCIVIENTNGKGHLRQARKVLDEKREELLKGIGFTTRDIRPERGEDIKIRAIRQFVLPGRSDGKKSPAPITPEHGRKTDETSGRQRDGQKR